MNADTSTSDNLWQQAWLNEFESICAFSDNEVPGILSEIAAQPGLTDLFGFIQQFTGSETNPEGFALIKRFTQAKTFDAIVELLVEAFLPAVERTMTNYQAIGLEQLDPCAHYLFISNHRDIVMDSLTLNILLHQHGFQTCYSAIGDNLLESKLANMIARLLHCFMVRRSLKSPREILKAMQIQSAYIRYLSFNKQANIWIAQKEGRSKDNLDRTNPALIKMLALARPKDVPFSDYIRKLNIVPFSISYEWDPCDIDKAKTLLALQQHGTYKKRDGEDADAMKTGLTENKGQVTLHFDDSLLNLDYQTEDHKSLALKIDRSIQSRYRTYAANLAAAELLIKEFNQPNPDPALAQLNVDNMLSAVQLSDKELNHAKEELQRRIENQNRDVQKKILEMYCAPLMQSDI